MNEKEKKDDPLLKTRRSRSENKEPMLTEVKKEVDPLAIHDLDDKKKPQRFLFTTHQNLLYYLIYTRNKGCVALSRVMSINHSERAFLILSILYILGIAYFFYFMSWYATPTEKDCKRICGSYFSDINKTKEESRPLQDATANIEQTNSINDTSETLPKTGKILPLENVNTTCTGSDESPSEAKMMVGLGSGLTRTTTGKTPTNAFQSKENDTFNEQRIFTYKRFYDIKQKNEFVYGYIDAIQNLGQKHKRLPLGFDENGCRNVYAYQNNTITPSYVCVDALLEIMRNASNAANVQKRKDEEEELNCICGSQIGLFDNTVYFSSSFNIKGVDNEQTTSSKFRVTGDGDDHHKRQEGEEGEGEEEDDFGVVDEYGYAVYVKEDIKDYKSPNSVNKTRDVVSKKKCNNVEIIEGKELLLIDPIQVGGHLSFFGKDSVIFNYDGDEVSEITEAMCKKFHLDTKVEYFKVTKTRYITISKESCVSERVKKFGENVSSCLTLCNRLNRKVMDMVYIKKKE